MPYICTFPTFSDIHIATPFTWDMGHFLFVPSWDHIAYTHLWLTYTMPHTTPHLPAPHHFAHTHHPAHYLPTLLLPCCLPHTLPAPHHTPTPPHTHQPHYLTMPTLPHLPSFISGGRIRRAAPSPQDGEKHSSGAACAHSKTCYLYSALTYYLASLPYITFQQRAHAIGS